MWEAADAGDVPGLGTAARKALDRFMSTMERLRERVEAGAPVGDLIESCSRDRLPRGARGRAHDRGAGPHREPRGARPRSRASSTRRAPEGGTLDEFLQQIALVADADTLRDDEGLVTLMTLHNAKGLEFPIVFIIGMEDGVFPHSRALDEGGARGGAPALLRRHHARDARPHADLRAPARRASARSRSACARASSTRSPRELTDQRGEPRGPARLRTARRRAGRAPLAPRGRRPSRRHAVFRLGEDVVHAAFGEGVVTGVEPGGIVVVRFAGDGSERKLMADYAPDQAALTMVRRLLALASAIVLVDTAFYLAITPLLPSYVREFALTKGQAGVLAAAYPAGTFAGSLPGGWLAARLGVRPTVLVGLGLMSVASLGFAFGKSIVVLDFARFVQGLGGAFSWAGAMGWLIGAAPRENRGELIGSAMGAAIAGALLGPVLGTLAHALGPEVVFSRSASLGVGLMAWAARTPAAPASRAGSMRLLLGLTRDGDRGRRRCG